jgi:nucleotide-binding universal stress UspA family protein
MAEGENLAPNDILESAATRLQDAGLAADQRLLDGRPAQAILEEITQGGFEVTVLGAGKVPD